MLVNAYDPVEIATQEVKEYDAVLRAHHDAMNCRDCEEYLQKGITAFRWLERAEEVVTEAENDCVRANDQQVHDAIESLYRLWLGPCEYAEQWIAGVSEDGYFPDNIDEFRGCMIRATQWIRCVDAIRNATLPHEQLSEYANRK